MSTNVKVSWLARRYARRDEGRIFVWLDPLGPAWTRLRASTTRPPSVEFDEPIAVDDVQIQLDSSIEAKKHAFHISVGLHFAPRPSLVAIEAAG